MGFVLVADGGLNRRLLMAERTKVYDYGDRRQRAQGYERKHEDKDYDFGRASHGALPVRALTFRLTPSLNHRHRHHRGRHGHRRGDRRNAIPGACRATAPLGRLQTSARAWACAGPE